MANAICLMVAPAYFDKYRGSAIAIIMTGTGVGQAVVPLVIRALIDALSFRGAILVYGAILGNCCAAALVFHPLEWHQKSGKNKCMHHKPYEHQLVEPEHPCEKNKKRSLMTIKYTPSGASLFPAVTKLFRTVFQHLRVITNVRITMGAISIAVLVVGYANLLALYPFALQERGFPPHYASFCISISSVSNVLFRIIVSFVSDRPWFNRRISYIFSTSTAGITAISKCKLLFLPQLRNFH